MEARMTGALAKTLRSLTGLAGALALMQGAAHAQQLEQAFDQIFAEPAATAPNPQSITRPVPVTLAPQQRFAGSLDKIVTEAASPILGRIGVAAIDLDSGRAVDVLGDQPFPMASTSKIAIAATFLEGVDQGRWHLDDQFPLMLPVPSAKFSSAVAPVRAGPRLSAYELIRLSITRSDNPATDALLAAVGGPQAVNRWIARAGIVGMRIDRDIATLVRDDGQYNPATHIDVRDSVTPKAMVRLLSGLHRGEWLSPSSRAVLMNAMENCLTGKHRMKAQLPEGTQIAHKTGTLNNTASDVGLIKTSDGRTMAVAIYVTGQGGKPNRDARIANIARTIYDAYQVETSSQRRTAVR